MGLPGVGPVIAKRIAEFPSSIRFFVHMRIWSIRIGKNRREPEGADRVLNVLRLLCAGSGKHSF